MAMLATAALFAACDDTQEGTEPGGDSQPNVVVFQQTADEEYDADMTTKLRLAVNSATEAVYVLTESAADYAAHYKDDESYAEYVVGNGTEVAIPDDMTVDYHVSCGGLNYITAVAVKGNTRKMAPSVTFTGYTYSQVEGTEDYVFTDPWGLVCDAQLVVCNEIPTNYRLKGVSLSKFGDETFNIDMSVYTDKNGDAVKSDAGETYLRVLAQETPYTYGSYGVVAIRDIAEWQADVSFVESAYGCTITDDGQLYLALNIYVSAGNLVKVAEATFGPAGTSAE